jgi:hypothetical protein
MKRQRKSCEHNSIYIYIEEAYRQKIKELNSNLSCEKFSSPMAGIVRLEKANFRILVFYHPHKEFSKSQILKSFQFKQHMIKRR